MRIKVNGEDQHASEQLTLERLVHSVTHAPSGVAAAVNEQVVPRGHWAGTALAEGDRVEILTAVQGG